MDIEHHKEQDLPDGCVSACCRIALSYLEQVDLEEVSLHTNLATGRRVSLSTAAKYFGWYFASWDLTDPDTFAYLWSLLQKGQWLIVTVGGPMLAMLNQQENRDHSQHGQLAVPDNHHMPPYHAIVLVAVEQNRVLYLDPWFPKHGQPYSMHREEFARLASGEVCIPQTKGI